MEDLGEVIENFVETFSCKEEPSSHLPGKEVPSTHANLLVGSSRYGHLFAAVGSSIVVYSYATLREGEARPVAVADLKEQNVTAIYALAPGAHDTIIAHVAINSGRFVVILSLSALAAGKIHALPGPVVDVSSFSVSDLSSSGNRQQLAILRDAGVELYHITAAGTAQATNIDLPNAQCAALSAEGELLAVGTERGSIVIYRAETGDNCATIVEVESGWIPFATYFADSRSVLVSYNCETEVRHVVWHLSSDGSSITGHSPLGELCLAFLPFSDEEPAQTPTRPMITCIALQDWKMCVIGSSMSSDVEIIRKTASGWEVWKFDEGKSPTLPTDDNDDDTYCVGLAFDLNNTAFIPGSDAASPKINPMPRVIVYTSDALLLPFALIDGLPGVKCSAVKSAIELPTTPVHLRSIQSAVHATADTSAVPANQSGHDTDVDATAIFNLHQQGHSSIPRYNQGDLSGNTATIDSDDETLLRSSTQSSNIYLESGPKSRPMNATQGTAESSTSTKLSKGILSQGQSFEGANSFLENFSFSKSSEEQFRATVGSSLLIPSMKSPEWGKLETSRANAIPEKPKKSLAPSLDIAEAQANGGNLHGLLKSILTEMAEELNVSAEAEQMVSKEIASQSQSMRASIDKTRECLTELLQSTRVLFRNELNLRNGVSVTLRKVLALSREYEKLSLEFRVTETDGFSRSLSTEEKKFDEKIASKEAEVLRSLSSIEERLNAETELQIRRKSPFDLVQQVYSSLNLQGIRIKRVRSLLAALSQQMDNQDKGDRLSHLGLSLARLEKLNIHDDDISSKRQIPEKTERRQSGGMEAAGTANGIDNRQGSESISNQGDDTQLMSSDVRAVMRRLAMRGGRANISATVPHSHTKKNRATAARDGVRLSSTHNSRAMTEVGGNSAMLTDQVSYERGLSNLSMLRTSGINITDRENLLKSENQSASLLPPKATTSGFPGDGEIDKIYNPSSRQSTFAPTFVDSASTSRLKGNESIRLKTSALPFVSEASRFKSPGTTATILSSSLPPKKPPNQTLYPPSFRTRAPLDTPAGVFNLAGKMPKEPSESKQDLDALTANKSTDSNERIPQTNFTEGKNEGQSSSGISPDSTRAKSLSDESSLGISGTLSDNVSCKHQASKKVNILSAMSSASTEKSLTSAAVEFASLPPQDDDGPYKPPNQSAPKDKVDPPKVASTSGLYAALPPDDSAVDIRKSPSEDKTRKVETTQSQNNSRELPSTLGHYASLPPEPDVRSASKSESENRDNKETHASLLGRSAAGSTPEQSSPAAEKEPLRTSDLFASLPPDESVEEPSYPNRFGGQSPLHSAEAKNSQETDVKSAVTPASMNDNDGSHRAPHRSTSVFTNTGVSESTAGSGGGQFSSPFASLEQSNTAFESASFFSASSPGAQTVTTVSAPERQSSRDGTSSDESEEESTRFEGGMDASSAGAGFFGTSSSAQSSQPFGFGSASNSMAGVSSFGQSSTSPFGPLSHSPSFGKSSFSQSQAQTGFSSLTGAQESVPSAFQNAQPTFGATSSFGAPSAFATAITTPAFGMESTFGAALPPRASSSFGEHSQLGAGSSQFGSSNPTFGSGMPAPKFGESSFGMTPSFGSLSQSSAGGGSGNSSSLSGASPFSNRAVSSEFGGASGGGSGFAALAGGQSGSLVFGNGAGPPSFTSAAFSQRRA